MVRVASVFDLREARAERGLQHGGWIVGAQVQPGAGAGMLILRRVRQ